MMKFYAAFKGVDLDEDKETDSKEAFERAERRAQAKIMGLSDEEVDKHVDLLEFADFGIEVESE